MSPRLCIDHIAERARRSHGHRMVMAMVTAGLTSLPLTALAHGGEDHSHVHAPVAAPTETESVNRSASSELVELVLKLDRAEAGQVRQARLFLSDYASNAPIADATLTVDWGEELISTATATAQAGIYTADVQFPTAGTYAPLITLTAGEFSDLLTLDPIEVSDPPAASWPMREAAIVLGVGLGAGLIGWRLRRRSAKALATPTPEVSP